MATDKTVEEIEHFISDLRRQLPRVGYHYEELQRYLLHAGFFAMRFDREWIHLVGDEEVVLVDGRRADRLLRRVMHNRVGIINGVTNTGKGHTVAWDGKMILDPGGLKYRYRFAQDYNFNPIEFVWISRIKV